MKHILKQLNQKPIAYYPVYREITGSTTAGILLSQLMYWFSKKDKIFKTDKEIQEETLLSEKELRNAKKLIKNLDFITVSREGLPAKTFYEIDWEKMYSSLAQWSKLEKPKGQNTTSQKGETLHDQRAKHSIYTENTTENTTEIKENENKKNQILLPKNLNIEAFKMWCNYKGKSYSNQGKKLSINKLINYPKDMQMQMVENSIMNNYKGLFEVKQNNAAANNTFAIADKTYDENEEF